MALRGKVCVVTGGSSGIGLATGRALATEGATVVLLARGRERLQRAAEALRGLAGQVHALVADVSASDDVERVACFLAELSGRADLLLNNAGVAPPQVPLHELPIEEYERVMRINLRGPWLMTRALVPLLSVRAGAQVINVTSGLKANPSWGVYSLSKSGIDVLTQVMAEELKPLGIRVNAFNPGWVRTAMAPDAPHAVETVLPRLLELARSGPEGPTGEEIHA